MIRKLTILMSIFALTLSLFASFAVAGEAKAVTLEGSVVCAKCALHEEGRKKCQNVLVVEKGEDTKHYYMAKNEANDKFGEVCMGTPEVRVTGTVEEKGGKSWIVATSIERVGGDKG